MEHSGKFRNIPEHSNEQIEKPWLCSVLLQNTQEAALQLRLVFLPTS